VSDEQTVASCLPSIGEIFRMYGPAYLAKFADRMSTDQIKALVDVHGPG
jgi:hypothetical protein